MIPYFRISENRSPKESYDSDLRIVTTDGYAYGRGHGHQEDWSIYWVGAHEDLSG